MDSSHPDPDQPACGVARQGFAAYLDGSASRASQRHLRAHLAGCPGCRAEFAGGIALTSHVARGARAAREVEGRLRRRRQQRSLALAGAFSGWTVGSRGAHLRLLLVPAFLILMITRVAPGPAPSAAERARIEALQGEVLVGSLPLAEAAEPRALRRGEACVTGPDGRARVTTGTGALELDGDTILWIEDDRAARVRLGEGRLEVEGGATLTTLLGVLECAQVRARVELFEGELSVEVRAGELRFFDCQGERALHAGESLRLP